MSKESLVTEILKYSIKTLFYENKYTIILLQNTPPRPPPKEEEKSLKMWVHSSTACFNSFPTSYVVLRVEISRASGLTCMHIYFLFQCHTIS